MLALTRALLDLRRSRAALNRGSYRVLESSSDECVVYLRQCDNQGGVVGNARSVLLSARGLLEFARPLMERLGRDPKVANELSEMQATA